MVTRESIENFVAQKKLAVVGVSRTGKKFGNSAFRELKQKGYTLYPIHPSATELEGEKAYPSFNQLPEPVGGVLIMVPPDQTVEVLQEAADAGISKVWIQQGAESEEAIQICEENNLSAVYEHCILMFAEPAAFIHKAHRWIWNVLGKVPK